jgi:ion channel
MRILVSLMGVALILIIFLDAFEAIVLPRRVTRQWRLIRFFYRLTWIPWSALGRRMHSRKRREAFLSFFGPMSLLLLLCVWAFGLITGFALLQWALLSPLNISDRLVGFGTYLYMSGTTFFTLGFGDVTPMAGAGRTLAVVESGVGFGFLALVIGYLPVIYQGFSRRETTISLLDARAGSPPSGTELLRRHGQNMDDLDLLLREWEHWSADLMETHLSYPVLCYYRSQHDNQSWLAALATILDASAMVIVGIDGAPARQASLTFAIARHAVVDLAQIFNTPPRAPVPDRLLMSDLARLRAVLASAGINLRAGPAADEKLSELRRMYEPYVNAFADYLLMPIPAWIPSEETFDSWQTSAWGRISTGSAPLPLMESQDDEHF